MSSGLPPVPPTSSLMNSYSYNEDDDDALNMFGHGLSVDYSDTMGLPLYELSPAPTKYNPPPPFEYPMIYGYCVPNNDSPSPHSPTALSPPGVFNGSMSSPPTVPSPISPQHSPPTIVPNDVKPIGGIKVKAEATDYSKWEPYIDCERSYCGLFNSKHEPISSTINLRCRLVAENSAYSPPNNAYILYRQNQFHVEVDFVGGLGLTSYCTNSEGEEPFYIVKNTPQGARFVDVEGLYFYMYAVKQSKDQAFDSDLVDIHQSYRSRGAKEPHHPPGYHGIENGRANFNKLQFKAATANNSRNGKALQQFYRIIVALVAKVGDDQYECICTNMSPCYIVRGQNPDRFKDKQDAINAIPISSSPITTTTTTTTTTTASNVTEGKRKAHALSVNVKLEPNKSDTEKRKKPCPTPAAATPKADVVEISGDSKWTKQPATNTLHIADGKIGINTSAPPEALSVNGNIMLTGSILKPSDKRIKTNIQPVSTASQLENIKQLKIYDYELIHGKEAGATGDKERGLLAQELKELLPNATRTINDVTMADGAVMEQLIVVDERTLLYETIGGVQELSDLVKQDQERLLSMDKKLETCVKENAQEAEAAQQTLQTADKLLNYMLTTKAENAKTKNGVCCIMINQTNKGFYGSIFSLGPAWTLYLLGLYLPLLWFCGGLFAFSPNKKKRLAGFVHIATFCIWAIPAAVIYAYTYEVFGPYYLLACQLFVAVVGTAAAAIRWKYRRNKKISYRRERASRPEYILQVKEKEGVQDAVKNEEKDAVKVAVENEEEEEDRKNLEEGMKKKKSKKNKKYVSIPMEELEEAVNAVTKPKSSMIKMKTLNSSSSPSAKEEWERNALLSTPV